MVENAFSTTNANSGDEALLQSLFSRLSPSPASVLKAALHFASQHPAHLRPELLLAALKLRGQQQAVGWIGELEPTLGTQEVMLQTGLSKSGVHKAKEENRLLAFRHEGRNADRFPLLQFKAGKVRDWVPKLLSMIGNGLAPAHFLAVRRKRLEGRSYLDLLSEGDDDAVIAAMLEHAASIGDEAHGAEPPAKRP